MGDLKVDTFVKWNSQNGGLGIGVLKSFKDENKLAVIETPTGLLSEIASANLIDCSKEEYEEAVNDIITSVDKHKNKKVKKAKAEDETYMKDQLEAMEKQLANYTEKFTAMEKQYAETQAALAEMTKKYSDAMQTVEAMKKEYEAKASELSQANEKINQFTKAKLAENRLSQLKAVEAVDYVAASDSEALTVLAELDQKNFDSILQVSTAAFKKLTDMTKSNMSKSTDQTKTNLPKSTEQTKAEEVLDTAKKEEEALALAQAATAANAQNALSKFAEQVIGKKIQKKSE